jgi:hypothetical protein
MKIVLRFVGMMAVLLLGFALVSCAGSSKKKEQPKEEAAIEQKGSLSRSFTLVDDQGRNSGSITLDPFGGAVLRDENGKVIGTFKAASSPEPQPVATPSEPDPAEGPMEAESSEAQTDTEAEE